MMAIQFVANCASHRVEVGEVIVLCGNSLMIDEPKDVVLHASAHGVSVAPSNARHRHSLIADAAVFAGLEHPEAAPMHIDIKIDSPT